MPDTLPFVCPHCQRKSWHPRDLEERFCAACGFADDVDRAKAAYRDDSYIERECDFCQRLYRGRAVYCSLECAMADAG